MLYQVEERKAARQQQQQMIQVVAALGGNARAFRQERARKTQAIVAEFFFPPMIPALAQEWPSYGIAPGLALVLTVPDENAEPWDFSRPSKKLLDVQAPALLVVSPMCTAFTTWQFINNKKRDPNIVQADKKAG